MLKNRPWLPIVCFEGEGSASGEGAPSHWYAGADPETVGYIQARGLGTKSPAEAALEAIKSHREAEKLIGAPAAQIIRVPTDLNDAAGWSKVWSRLGTPADAKEYDLSTIKRMGDQPLDPQFEGAVRSTMHMAGVPKSMASTVVSGLVKHLDSVEQARVAEEQAKLAEERRDLEKDWGQHFAVNKAVAANAARALGLSPEIIGALEKVSGYKSVMQAMLTLGRKIGEAPFHAGENGGNGAMSREQAIARRGELQRDKDWTARYLKGGAAEKREMLALNQIITGSEV